MEIELYAVEIRFKNYYPNNHIGSTRLGRLFALSNGLPISYVILITASYIM